MRKVKNIQPQQEKHYSLKKQSVNREIYIYFVEFTTAVEMTRLNLTSCNNALLAHSLPYTHALVFSERRR